MARSVPNKTDDALVHVVALMPTTKSPGRLQLLFRPFEEARAGFILHFAPCLFAWTSTQPDRGTLAVMEFVGPSPCRFIDRRDLSGILESVLSELELDLTEPQACADLSRAMFSLPDEALLPFAPRRHRIRLPAQSARELVTAFRVEMYPDISGDQRLW